MDVDAAAPPAPAPENADDTPGTSEPAILPHLAIGINQVTKRLEAQARLLRQAAFSTSDSSTTVTATHRPLRVVFVCREDIDPPMLVAHIPTLIASYNSASSARSTESLVKLVPLAKGAEFTLAAAFGLRRVAVMALDVSLTLRASCSRTYAYPPSVRCARFGIFERVARQCASLDSRLAHSAARANDHRQNAGADPCQTTPDYGAQGHESGEG